MCNSYIVASCYLTKIQSRVKGHLVYNYAFKVGEVLNFSIDNDNQYNENAIAVLSSCKKVVGHIPKPLAKILFPRMTYWRTLQLKVEYQEKRALLLKTLGYCQATLKHLPHFMLIELQTVNFNNTDAEQE